MRDNWASNLTAGIGAGIAYLPLMVVISIIAFGPLGGPAAAMMTGTVLAANIAAGIVFLLLSRCPILVGSPSGSSALVMAALFGRLVAQGHTPDVAEAMAITLSTGLVTAAVVLALVKAGAAGLGPLAPYPVVSGLVNGTAALILLSQVPAMRAHPFQVLIALATAVTMVRFPIRWRVPPVLPAVAAGVAVDAALRAAGLDAGPALAAMPSPLAFPIQAAGAYATWGTSLTTLPWRDILTAGVTIALLSVLETLGSISALNDAGVVTGGRRDLTAVGLANLAVAAAAGGPPVSAPLAGAMGLLRTGGTGRLAPLSRLATIAVGATFLGGFLPYVPQGAMAGLVLAIGYRLVDLEPGRLLWRAARQRTPHRLEIAGSSLISLTVVAIAVFAGLALAVAAGAVACLLVFTAAMAGSAVRRTYDGAAALSRVRRSAEETAVLYRERKAVAVLELAGPLFFGNVSPLAAALDAAKADGARHVVVDLSRVVRVDLSGARRLIAIVRQARQQGLTVVLTPDRPGHPVADYFAALGIAAGESYPELTAALAATEAAILAEAGLATPHFDTAEDALRALGVSPEQARALAARAETRDLAADEVLCHAGEPADAVFIIMQGQADVLLPRTAETPSRVLLAHLFAGTVVGERALFEAGIRTADVVCTVPSRVLILGGPALAALMLDASPDSLALLLAITRHTSVSLQLANAAIQRLEV